MRIIAAHALALRVSLRRRSGWTGKMIAKRNVLMREIAYCLHPRPSRCEMAEQAPGIRHEPLSLAITTSQQKNQRVLRQRLDGVFLGMWVCRIWKTIIL